MSRRLHIAFVNSWYPNRVFPTNGDFIQRHAEAVATMHRVSALHVVTDPQVKGEIEWVQFAKNGVETRIAYLPVSRTPLGKVRLFWKAYRRLLAMGDPPDILHINRVFPAGAVALVDRIVKKIPYIITEHWTGYHPDRRSAVSLVERWIVPRITSRASFVCPVSEDLAQSMQALGFEGRYRPVPNVVNTALFQPGEEGRTSKDAFTVLHVSNMVDAHKNVTGLLEAMASFMKSEAKVRLILIGDRPQRYLPFIRQQSIPLERCELIDQIPQEQLAEYMRRADVFVLFSHKENLPCVILESFASGTPVISTDVGGISEFLPDDFGYLIPKNDTEGLKEALRNMYLGRMPLAPPEKMHAYARAHFSPVAVARAFDALYRQALEE